MSYLADQNIPLNVRTELANKALALVEAMFNAKIMQQEHGLESTIESRDKSDLADDLLANAYDALDTIVSFTVNKIYY